MRKPTNYEAKTLALGGAITYTPSTRRKRLLRRIKEALAIMAYNRLGVVPVGYCLNRKNGKVEKNG